VSTKRWLCGEVEKKDDTSSLSLPSDSLDMSEPLRRELRTVQQEITELAQRALIQAGDLQAIEEKLYEIVKRNGVVEPDSGESESMQ
jgi:hypothetical protein